MVQGPQRRAEVGWWVLEQKLRSSRRASTQLLTLSDMSAFNPFLISV